MKAFILVAALSVPFAAAVTPRNKTSLRKAVLSVSPRQEVLSYDDYELPFRDARRHRISSGFGWRWHPIRGMARAHRGLDFPKPYGTPVYPSRGGVVSFAGRRDGYGRIVEITHNDGGLTVYGHLARFFVATGQSVGKDNLLGLVGSSGLSTGPHLHFEYRGPSGMAFDPRHIITRR